MSAIDLIPNRGQGVLNAGDKPKSRKITTYVEAELDKPWLINHAESPTMAQEIARNWALRSIADQHSLDSLLDRTEGKLASKIEMTSEVYVACSVRFISGYFPDTPEQLAELQQKAMEAGLPMKQYAVQCLTQCLGEGP